MKNLLVEYRFIDNLKVINEGSGPNKKLKVRGIFQRADEQNNNGRIYPKKVLESQVKALQEKISDRSLVGALDHPPNDAIHLSQASHLITRLWMENNEVYGEAEILSTPMGKVVNALLNDGVKVGISSRGLGSVSDMSEGQVVNEDFRLITFDLVSDPSTRGAYPSLTESTEFSAKVKKIKDRVKSQQIFLKVLSDKIDEALSERRSYEPGDESPEQMFNRFDRKSKYGSAYGPPPPTTPEEKTKKPKEHPKQKKFKFKYSEGTLKKIRNGLFEMCKSKKHKKKGNKVMESLRKKFQEKIQK